MQKYPHLISVFLSFFLLMTFCINAQTPVDSIEVMVTDPQLMVKSRTKDGKVDIRWAPNDHLLFRIANRKGYRLERKDTVANKWITLLDRGPYTVEEFKANLDTTNVHVATAAQCVYGAPLAQINPANVLGSAKELEEEQNMRYAFALLSADYEKQAAEGLALGFQDKVLVPGAIQIYRLYIRDLNPEEAAMDTTFFVVNTSIISAPTPVQKILVYPEPNHIVIKWGKEENDLFFSGYYIERSEDEGKTFKRLNDQPLLTSDSEEFDEFNAFHLYSDKDVLSGKSYHYRVVGVTPFGDEGLPSETILSKAIDVNGPMPPVNVDARDIGNNTIRVSWETSQISEDQTGFVVWRAAGPTGPFYPLFENPLPNTIREYIDKNAIPIQANYYIVYALDDKANQNGSAITMAVWYDTIPPAQPQALAGYIDTSGYLTLAWAYGEEADLQGYNIYWSNGPDREFYPLNAKPVQGNIFLDSITMETISEKIFYKIVAVDFNMNQSDPSEVLELIRPDIIRPAAPMLSAYKSYPDSISITWQLSPSKDVVAYQVFRKLAGQEKYDVLTTISDPRQNTFTDKSTKAGQTYVYAIVAIDDAMLYSEISDPYTITALKVLKRVPISNLIGRIDEATAEFELTWSYQAQGDYEFVIFRNVDDNGWQNVANIRKSQQSYIDKNLFRASSNFKYAVQVIYKDGGEAPLSNIVQLNLLD